MSFGGGSSLAGDGRANTVCVLEPLVSGLAALQATGHQSAHFLSLGPSPLTEARADQPLTTSECMASRGATRWARRWRGWTRSCSCSRPKRCPCAGRRPGARGAIVSDVDVPGFDRATMDGYAVVADSTEGATAYNRVPLTSSAMRCRARRSTARSGAARRFAS